MTKTHKSNIGGFIAALIIAGFTTSFVWADVQMIPFSVHSGTGGAGCPGSYTGYVKMTNNLGTFWLTPPTNATSGTLTDASGFAPPYVSIAQVVRKSDSSKWCETNSVTFPVTNTTQYSFTVYVKSTPPPPTNGQPISMQIIWH